MTKLIEYRAKANPMLRAALVVLLMAVMSSCGKQPAPTPGERKPAEPSRPVMGIDCPTCKKKGAQHTIQQLPDGPRTLIAWEPHQDKDGKTHHHDPNTHTSRYKCSNGHEWSVASSRSCWCGWGKPSKEREEKK